ncbi:MAG TPA: hypothetical protein VND98_00970 [Solirubrobacterales bacterium]|nr:hypothetical protein [Solirubrobacterales bacterium]
MEILREKNDERLQILLTDMALYFAEFTPASAENQYGKLVDLLGQDHLASTVFASLNYDCLFELTAGSRHLPVNYWLGTPLSGVISLLKLHGSCNFVMQGLGTNIRMTDVTMSQIGVAFYEGPLEARHPTEIASLYANGPSMPPAISLYTTGKASMTGPSAIAAVREKWAAWVGQADVILPIGARVVLADHHVWEPMVESQADVWFVGGSEGDFDTLRQQLGPRLIELAGSFDEAVPIIGRRLRLLR